MDTYARLKDGTKWMWSLGDYPSLAVRLQPYAEALAAAASIEPGMRVLDVAAGDGNLALAAARRGAAVTACDLTPRMVELGRARSEATGLSIEWREADAEELPFPPAGFDVVASVFGAMFAPRPERVAAELFRVARPVGLVAMANYDGGGLMGRVSELISSFGPPPSVDLPSPFSWGDPGEVRSRFRELASSVEVNGRTGRFEFGSVEEGVEFWERTNPPLSALRALLSEEAHRDVVAALTRLFSRLNATNDGRLVLEWGYVEVLARKPGPA